MAMKQFNKLSLDFSPKRKHFFMGFGKKKDSSPRPGTLTEKEIEAKVKQIGLFKKALISRVDYDGELLEAIPVVITAFHTDGFIGKVVNVDREVREEDSDTEIFIDGGGGTIDFHYNDGDIASIEIDVDNEIVTSDVTNEQILEILEALDPGDNVLVSYYDAYAGAFRNGVGTLIEKSVEKETFSVEFHTLNKHELKAPKRVNLDLNQNRVLDLQMQ
jgi:hypothetical protein